MTIRPLLLSLAIAAIVAGTCLPRRPHPRRTPPAAATPASDKAAKLNALYDEYWEATAEAQPGAGHVPGRQPLQRPAARFLQRRIPRSSRTPSPRTGCKRIEAVGSDGLAGQDLLSYEIFVRDAKDSLESEQFPDWMMPVNQMGSIASYAVMLGSGTGAQPFKTVKDYDNWLARGNRLPVLFDTAIDNMRQGMKAGVVQPRALMEKVMPQLDALIKDKPEDTLLWGPIKSMPADFSAADKTRLTAAYREMIGERHHAGLPQAARLHRRRIPARRPATASASTSCPTARPGTRSTRATATTTDMTPAQIHQLGLDEVARIHGEIRKVMAEVGFKGSLQEFFQFMKTDPQFELQERGRAAGLLPRARGAHQQAHPGAVLAAARRRRSRSARSSRSAPSPPPAASTCRRARTVRVPASSTSTPTTCPRARPGTPRTCTCTRRSPATTSSWRCSRN